MIHATFTDDPAAFDAGQSILAMSTFGYDAGGRRVYAKCYPMPARSQAYTYDGLNRLTKAVDTSAQKMTLSMREGHPLALAVREGFRAADCAIEANLTSDWAGGIAFRIQDKNNYFMVFPYSDYVFLCWGKDGNWTLVDMGYVADSLDWSVPCDWYLRADADRLDLTVTVGSTPVTVFDADTNGAGLLAGEPGGRGDRAGHHRLGGVGDLQRLHVRLRPGWRWGRYAGDWRGYLRYVIPDHRAGLRCGGQPDG